MSTARSAGMTWRSAVTNRAFGVHYLQMIGAMLAGMAVLMPLSMLVGEGVGAEVDALFMASQWPLA